ncbi:SCO1 [Candida jiufengensis]|uniref:SCO1 n=1 Tax=Candida jiufengensis TaxID=497108 RepID=UPI00222539CD|nr:SCO1 [Candida jiufengensis]KAI5957232.1 SCO1 [Candida jiufengensis]
MLSKTLFRQTRISNVRRLLLQPTIRSFSQTFTKFQEVSKEPSSTSSEQPKRRPLSRVAIGGSKDSNKNFNKGSGLEFATWKAVVLLVVVGGIGTYFFQKEKARLHQLREMEQNKKIGKPLIGGPFKLMDTNGNEFTEQNLIDPKGKKFSILYFGFSHCPDVCPEELDKLGDMLDILKENKVEIQPIFITCDPARDSPEVLSKYLEDFHPGIIGLTGSYEAVKDTCKKYRVYFSTPPDVKPGQDYLVDHSIFFYVLDPEGNFVDVIGRESLAPQSAEKITQCSEAFIPSDQIEAKKQGMFGFLYK